MESELTKEIIQEIFKNMTGTTDGLPNAVLSTTSGELKEDDGSFDAAGVPIAYEQCALELSVDPMLPRFLTLKVISENPMTINGLWFRYNALTKEHAEGRKTLLAFDMLGTCPYTNDKDEYDAPIYAKVSAVNPIFASKGKVYGTEEQDNMVTLLFPIESVGLETFKEDLLTELDQVDQSYE